MGIAGNNEAWGIDIAPPFGTLIYATHDGTVTFAGEHPSYGRYIPLYKGDGVQTLYAHCAQLLISEGDQIIKGQMIAQVGSTGDSIGPQLHYEIQVGGERQNPLEYLQLKSEL